MMYQKKPEEIMAIRWDGKNEGFIRRKLDARRSIWVTGGALVVNTKDGHMIASPGDYISKNDEEELVIYSPKQLQEIFVPVEAMAELELV